MTQSLHNGKPAANARQDLIGGAYVRNAWYAAAWSDGLADGRVIARTIMDEPIVLYRKADGGVAAIEDRCAHRFAPLSMGKIVHGDRIQCPYHGLEYDGTGACVHNPHGNKTIPPRARVKSYPAVEKHKTIWLWMGDAPADASKVPDFGVLDNVPELHTTKRDSIVIRANYQLIIDNLLDLSHTSYLHEGILGNADTVESEIMVEQDGDDVIVGRLATNSAPPGMFAQFWPGQNCANMPGGAELVARRPTTTSSPSCSTVISDSTVSALPRMPSCRYEVCDRSSRLSMMSW